MRLKLACGRFLGTPDELANLRVTLVGTGKAWCDMGDTIQVRVGCQLDVSGVDVQCLSAPLLCGERDLDLPVAALAGPVGLTCVLGPYYRYWLGQSTRGLRETVDSPGSGRQDSLPVYGPSQMYVVCARRVRQVNPHI